MKRFLSIILSMTMLLSCISAVGFASDENFAGITDATFSSIIMNVGADETMRNITWYSDYKTEGEVRWAKASDMTDGAFPESYGSVPAIVIDTTKTGYYSYKATISCLEENTDYVYCLVVGDTVSELYSFETKSFSDNYSFALVGDPQVGISGGPVWSDALSKIKANFPKTAFVVSAGDQTSTPTDEVNYDNFIVPELASMPISITLGTTHDNAQPYKEHYNLPNLSSTYGVSAISSDYYYTYSSTLFMHINVESADVDSHAAFVERTVKNHPECIWQIVIIHYPMYYDKTSSDSYTTKLSGLFSELGIDAVFSGHIHRYMRSKLISDALTVSDDVVENNTVTDPVGALYITASPILSGNFIAGDENYDYVEKMDWSGRKSVVMFDMTETSLTMNSYYIDQTTPELFDSFTIYHTPEKVRLNGNTNMLEVLDGEERVPLVDAYAYENATVKVDDGNWALSEDGGSVYNSLGIESDDTDTVLSLNTETGYWELSEDCGASFEATGINVNTYTVTYVTDINASGVTDLSKYPTHTVAAGEAPDDIDLTLPTGSLAEGVLYEWEWKYYSLDSNEVSEFKAGEDYVAVLNRRDLAVSNTLYIANQTDAANGVYTWTEAWDIVKSFPGNEFELVLTEDIILASDAGVSVSMPVDITIDLAGYVMDTSAVANLISMPTGADKSDIDIITSKENGAINAKSVYYINSSARTTLNLSVGSPESKPISVSGTYIVNAGNNFKNNSHLYLDIYEGTYELTSGLFLVYNLGTNHNNYYVTVNNADVSVGVAPVCFNTYTARNTSTFDAVSSKFSYTGKKTADFFAIDNWQGSATFTECGFNGIVFNPENMANITNVTFNKGCVFENSDLTFNSNKTAFASDKATLAEGLELVQINGKVYCVAKGQIPTKQISIGEAESAYVAGASKADESYEEEEKLLVSGSDKTSSDRNVYAKLNLSDYESGKPAMLTLKSLSNNFGTINIYGVKDVNSSGWSAGSIEYDNAAAIDASGNIDLNAVFKGAPLASLEIAGAGYYTADISDFVFEMKSRGAEEATVILASETEGNSLNFEIADETTDKSAYYKVIDFDNKTTWVKIDGQREVNDNGDMRIGSAEESTANLKVGFDRTSSAGNSLELYANKTYNGFKFYNIFDHNLTSEDIGRKFKVSLWVYSQADHKFDMGLTSVTTPSDEALAAGYKNYYNAFYTENNPKKTVEVSKGKWTKVEYVITVTEEMTDEFWGEGDSMLLYKPALFTIVPQVEGGSTMYIDDIVVEEQKMHYKTITFDDWSKLSSGRTTEVNSSYNYNVWGGTGCTTTLEPTDRDKATGKSVKLVRNGNVIWKFYNTFDHNLTAEDVGRSFTASIWVKPESDITVTIGFTSAAHATYKKSFYTSTKHNVKEGKWQKIEHVFTVDEGMLAASYDEAYNNPALFSIMIPDLSTIWVDDIEFVEFKKTAESEEKTPHTTSFVFDDWEKLKSGNGLEVNDSYNIGVYGVGNSEWSLDTTVDRLGKEGGKSFKLYKDGWTIWKLYNMFDHNLTSADIGRKFRVTAWVKSDVDTTVNLGLSSGGKGDDNGFPRYNNTFYEKSSKAITAGEWEQMVFEFTVDKTMLAETYTGYETSRYNPALLAISHTTLTTIWVDDINVLEYIDGVYQTVDTSDTVAISPSGVEMEGIGTAKSAEVSNEGIKKAYIHFESAELENLRSATLNINVEQAAGQTLKVYGIIDSSYPDNLTYNTAPGTNADTSMDSKKIYGGEAIGEIVVSEDGSYSFDVTDYIKSNSGSDCIFAVTTEDSEAAISKNSTIAAEVIEQIMLTVSTVNGNNVSVNGENKNDTVTEYVCKGMPVELSANGDGEFLYWIDSDTNTILSYDESLIYTIASDRKLTAVYTDNDGAFVTFISNANKVVALGLASSITVPKNPYLYGYKFDSWYVKGGDKTELVAGGEIDAIEDTTYVAAFVKDNTKYEVNVNGEVRKHTYNEKVTLTAEAEKDGKAFSYWKRDGVIVSYNTEYSFYVNGDTTVEAVYGENVNGGIVLAMANPVLVEGSKIAFFAERNIPEEYTLIESGILIGYSAGVDIDNAQVKAIAKSTANKGQYTIRKAKLEDGITYYGAAYAIYRDASGVLNTAYSNEVSYEYKITE